MNFFEYREYMKKNTTALFTGLDETCRRRAPMRQMLRDALNGKRTMEELKTAAGVDNNELLVAYYMNGTNAETDGMETVRVPAPEEVLQTFKNNGMWDKHPRIMANAETFANIRAHKEELPYSNWVKTLKDRAEPYMEADFAPWVDAGDEEMPKKNYLGPCRTVKQRVQALAMLYHVTGELRYAERAKAEMLNFITYPTYYPEHYLNVAEACYALCLGYDWLYELFTEEERQNIRDAVKEKCFDTAYDLMKTTKGWAGTLNNWNQVCNGGIAIGAMTLMEYYPELCSELVSFAVKNMPRSLADISPDGVYPEGVMYWEYGTTYGTYFMAALDSVLGEDYGLSKLQGYAESMAYAMYCTAPQGSLASYADTHVLNKETGMMERGAPQSYWMADHFNEPAFAWFPLTYMPYSGLYEGGVYEMLWYKPQETVTPAQAEFPLDMTYDGTESMTFFRQNWTDEEAMYVLFKGGNNQSNHGCLDIGQFLLDRFGIRWAVDLQSESYAVPDYWDKIEGRWRYYRKRAEGHNTLLINPGEGADQDVFAACSIDTFGAAPGAAFSVCDITEAYAPFGAESVRRACMVFDNRTKLLVQDEVKCEKESTLWWRMHTEVKDVTVNGNVAVLKENGHTLRVTAQSPGAAFVLSGTEPVAPSKGDPYDSPNPEVQVLSLKLENVKEATLRVVFTFDGDDTLPPEMKIDEFAAFIQK